MPKQNFPKTDVKFEVLKTKDLLHGDKKFIEISDKKAITKDGENAFVQIATGWIDSGNKKRYKNSVSLPRDKKVLDNLAAEINSLLA